MTTINTDKFISEEERDLFGKALYEYNALYLYFSSY